MRSDMLKTLGVTILLFAPTVSFRTPVDLDLTTCAQIREFGRVAGLAGQDRIAFDTLQFFIENCSNTPESFRAFVSIRGALQGLDEPWSKKGPEYRDWLKDVLFLNTSDSQFYCAGISTLFLTFQNHADNAIPDYNGVIAVFDYLTSTDRCPESNLNYWKDRKYFREVQYSFWKDTVQDSVVTPFDTSAVTLESIGLDWIRGTSSVKAEGSTVTYLGEISLTSNPFREQAEVVLEMLRDGHARVEVYDLLGRPLFDLGNYKRFAEGRHEIGLPVDLPSGTLMLRVTTPSGEVKTIKIVKQ
jgi:hypothetical protein